MAARGECNCGAVRFAIDADLSGVYVCHCSICGSPVPGQNDANTMVVPAGTLSEGGETLKVIHHVRVNSKAVWDEIGDSGKQHPEGLRS